MALLFKLFESFAVFRMLGKPIVDNESIVVAKLLNCLPLAKLAVSKVDERGPECINEALLG